MLQIPVVDDISSFEQAEPGSLVRYRCMIQVTGHLNLLFLNVAVLLNYILQNIYDPELFFGEYDLVNDVTGEKLRVCGLFSDVLESRPGFRLDADSGVATERLPSHCMSIPGETSWLQNARRRAAPPSRRQASGESAAKRPHDDDEDMADAVMEDNPPSRDDTKRLRASHATASPAEASAGVRTTRPPLVHGAEVLDPPFLLSALASSKSLLFDSSSRHLPRRRRRRAFTVRSAHELGAYACGILI